MSTRVIALSAALCCGLYAADTVPPSDTSANQDSGTPQAPRHRRIRFGGITAGFGYTHWSGYPGYGYYGPWMPFAYPIWGSFFYHPAYLSGFGWGPSLGEVKLAADTKDADVFLDGAYAGKASERKSMWLEPGAYNLELRAPGREPYAKRIYVLSGKSLRVRANLGAQ